MRIDFISGSYQQNSKNANDAKLVNWLYRRNDGNKAYPVIIEPSPGMVSQNTELTANTTRGLHEKDGVLYIASANKIYKLVSTTVTELGTIGTSSGTVHFCSNFDYLMVTDGSKGYSYNFTSTTFAEITDADFTDTTATATCVRDFFFTHTGKTINYSSVNDPTAWSALDFVSAETSQETVQCLYPVLDFLLVMGRTKTEIYQIVGGTDPIKSLPGVLIPWGCAARDSVAQGKDGTITLSRGIQGDIDVVKIGRDLEAMPLGNDGLTTQLRNYTTISDAIAFIYQRRGVEYYQITFPTENKTWILNTDLGIWSELTSVVSATEGRHRAVYYAAWNGKNIISDRSNGNLYYLDDLTYTDAGTAINRLLRTSPFAIADGKHHIVRQLEVITQNAISNGSVTSPTLSMRKSTDGGTNFSNWRDKVVGQASYTEQKAIYTNLGRMKQFTLDIKTSDAVNMTLLGIVAIAEACSR